MRQRKWVEDNNRPGFTIASVHLRFPVFRAVPPTPPFHGRALPNLNTPLSVEGKMSRSLPPEVLDLIVGHLRDEPPTLKTCCLVSKSWIPRTRKHLFAHVEFCVWNHLTKSWVKTFPDPANTPAHHTRTLSVLYPTHYPRLIKAARTGIFSSFSSVVHLSLSVGWWHDETFSHVPLHGLSPVLRSLHLSFVVIPHSEILTLICSFPLLEDLALDSVRPEQRDGQWTTPSTSPRLTGSLELCIGMGGMQSITNPLVDLPNGLHFTKIVVVWFYKQDVTSTMYLLLSCSDTVQSLEVTSRLSGMFHSVSVYE